MPGGLHRGKTSPSRAPCGSPRPTAPSASFGSRWRSGQAKHLRRSCHPEGARFWLTQRPEDPQLLTGPGGRESTPAPSVKTRVTSSAERRGVRQRASLPSLGGRRDLPGPSSRRGRFIRDRGGRSRGRDPQLCLVDLRARLQQGAQDGTLLRPRRERARCALRRRVSDRLDPSLEIGVEPKGSVPLTLRHARRRYPCLASRASTARDERQPHSSFCTLCDASLPCVHCAHIMRCEAAPSGARTSPGA